MQCIYQTRLIMRILFLFLFLSAVFYNASAQKEYASIFVFVPGKLTVLPATIHVSINGIEVAELKKGESLEYRINNPQSILLEVQAKGMGLMSNPATTDLDVQDIREHYYQTKWTINGVKLEKVKSLPNKIDLKELKVLTDDSLYHVSQERAGIVDSTLVSGFGWTASGTGFFINEKGYIATNYHVIENASLFEVDVTNGSESETKSYKAVMISGDKLNDLAILKVDDDRFKPIKPIQYNFNPSVQDVGTQVFTLGYPLTDILGYEIKYTDGVISSKTGYQGDVTTYQMTVPIQPGNSGGPLFSADGELIGITSSGIDKQVADNANYAIKTVYLQTLIDSTNDKIKTPKYTKIKKSSTTEKIKILSNYVVLIKVR